MSDYTDKNVKNKIKEEIESFSEISNPLAEKKVSEMALSNFSQEINRPKYDADLNEIIEVVRILNNLAPLKMPVYNFNVDEINGDRYYRPDNNLLLIREYDSDVIRDYYITQKEEDAPFSIKYILERDKNTGILRTKIEPLKRVNGEIKINIIIFDTKYNNKYTVLQVNEEGIVNSITEFTGKGKSFQSLFRNTQTFKPVRYLEGRDTKDKDFFMSDCIFDSRGNVARIKKYNSKKERKIEYTKTKKNIIVRTKYA